VQSMESRALDAELAARRVRRDPLFGLDAGDTQKASGLAPFVREEAEVQPLDRLTETVRTALLTGTKVEKILTLRYAARRVEAERTPYAEDGPKARQQHPQAGHVHALATALDELEAHLAPPDAKERVQTAQERRAEANRLRAARGEADGSAARGIAQMRQRLGMLSPPTARPLGQREAHLTISPKDVRWVSVSAHRVGVAVDTRPTLQCGARQHGAQERGEEEGEICQRMRRRPARQGGSVMAS